MKNEKETFIYTYSAKEQDEIKAIRKKYEAPGEEEDKMTHLRRLDRAVYKKATAVALILGIVGALTLGFGMSLIMTDIGALLGIEGKLKMLVGVSVGVMGLLPMCLAYPVYERTLKKERKKIAPEILALTEELMK